MNSPRHLRPEHLDRLKQLVRETLIAVTRGERALILIPCCKSKNEHPTYSTLSTPLPDIDDLRRELLELLQKLPGLERPENKKGVLNPNAPLTRAIDLYTSNFYKKARKVLLDILHGKYPYIHVLIVSALYGLVNWMKELRSMN